jgi:hypothetical protein
MRSYFLLLIYWPTPNHILQLSSQASSAPVCTRSEPFQWVPKKKKKGVNKSLHARHAPCRDWCANLITAQLGSSFFFLFCSQSVLGPQRLPAPFQKKKKKREKKEKWIILFSVSGSSQRSSVFITSCHLPLASFLSPSAASVSLLH